MTSSSDNRAIIGSPPSYDSALRVITVEHPSVPPGLENILHLDKLHVIRQNQGFFNFSSSLKYEIRNDAGQVVLLAKQVHSFGRVTIHITDTAEREVIKATKEFKFFSSNRPLTVEAPPGHVIGYTTLRQDCCQSSTYEVTNAALQNIFSVELNTGDSCCDSRVEYKIMSQGVEIGAILYAPSDSVFGRRHDKRYVTFPVDLDVRMKVVLLCSVLLIIINEDAERQSQQSQSSS